MPSLMVVEWPDGLLPYGPQWEDIATRVNSARPDLLLTNEMPFGAWLPVADTYLPEAASDWVELHLRGVEALATLNVGAVLSSRPVHSGGRLANEAFTLVGGQYVACHHKHLFPEEPGWHEDTWFQNGMPGFDLHEVCGVRIAFLLCTELMFNEHARAVGRAGADVIVVPRATGQRTDTWKVAARMAAIVGGCYVATSNRRGRAVEEGPDFGGHGFVVAPGGQMLIATSLEASHAIVDVDLDLCASAKHDYPCNVRELHSPERSNLQKENHV